MSTFRRSSAWWLRAWRSACPPCLPRGPRPFEPAEPPRAVWIIAWSHPNPSVTSWPRAMWRCSACRITDSRPEVTTRRPGRLPGTTDTHCQAGTRSTDNEGNGTMRKLAIIPMAGVLILAIAAPAAAGANVSNSSGTAEVVNGEWYTANGSGYVYFATDSAYGAWGEFLDESGEWVPCDESGEYYGFVGSRTYGWSGDLAIEIDSRLDHATVSGTLDVYAETVNDCTGEYGGSGEATSVPFTADFNGVGSAVRFKSSGSYKLPGEFNSHS